MIEELVKACKLLSVAVDALDGKATMEYRLARDLAEANRHLRDCLLKYEMRGQHEI